MKDEHKGSCSSGMQQKTGSCSDSESKKMEHTGSCGSDAKKMEKTGSCGSSNDKKGSCC